MRTSALVIALLSTAGCAQQHQQPSQLTPRPPVVQSGPSWYAVPATPEQIAFAQEKAAYDLRDPGSAQFRNLYALTRGMGDDSVCGEINAKNAYGAYVGFSMFYVNHKGDVILTDPNDKIMGNMPKIICNKPPKP